MRTVRSKWWRRNLEVDAGGLCWICGGDLGEDWQPDHVKPWARGGETVPSNIRAACRRCNQRKGAMEFRAFQQWLHTTFTDVQAGLRPCPSEIVLDVGCGGGKSVGVLIIAHWLIEVLKVVDRVIWIVPNGSLREQAAEACDPDDVAAKLTGHRIEINESTNQGNPAKGKQGYVVTFSALAAARRYSGDGVENPHVEELSKLRYVAIWDEPHHMTMNGNDDEAKGYAKGAELVMRLAKINVFMSGTLFRHDRKPIAFMRYGADGKVDMDSTPDRWCHRYTIQDAIEDEAVIKTEFYLHDGRASWMYAGQPHAAESIKEDSTALWSALQTEFSDQVLTECVRHWRAWGAQHSRSKLLVVCANVKQAQRAVKVLGNLGVKAEIATYREDDADDRIKRFKKDGVDVLVTVQKAYEGLDVPQITHLACLTHIRSISWIQQAFARAWRYDRKGDPYEQQRAFVFAPADTLFQEIIDWIWQTFQPKILVPRPPPSDDDDDDDDDDDRTITPEHSDRTHTLLQVLGGDAWKSAEAADILTVQEELMARGMAPAPLDLLAAVVDILRAERREPAHASPKANGAIPRGPLPGISTYVTPGVRIERLRRDLATNVNAAARLLANETSLDTGACATTINGQIKKRWRQRNLMEEDELGAAISWVREYYDVR